ncbi:hypothetical protein O0L34_g11507 [Tuta absoluta]|nr:hypothetical protein O0L34_g11507 [Tuta absoluta]
MGCYCVFGTLPTIGIIALVTLLCCICCRKSKCCRNSSTHNEASFCPSNSQAAMLSEMIIGEGIDEKTILSATLLEDPTVPNCNCEKLAIEYPKLDIYQPKDDGFVSSLRKNVMFGCVRKR